jgi:hypothetical protein
MALNHLGAFAFGKHAGEFASLSFSHEESKSISTSTSTKNGDVTASKSDRDSYTDATGNTVYANGNGKVTDVAYDAKIQIHQTSASVATSTTTGTRAAGPNGTVIATSQTVGSTVGVSDTDKHAVIVKSVNGGSPTVIDVNTDRADVTTNTYVRDAQSVSKTTDNGDDKTTVTASASQTASAASDDYVVSKDGTITQNGKTISLKEVGIGSIDTQYASSATAASVTTSDVDRKKNGDYSVNGTTTSVSDTVSLSESERTFEGILSSSSSNGKTTVRFIDITEDISSVDDRKTVSIDRFSRQVDIDKAKAQKADHDGNTTVTTSATDSASETIAAGVRTDNVSKLAPGTTLDTIAEARGSITDFTSKTVSHTDGANAVDTNSTRSVRGETVRFSATEAAVLTTSSTAKTASGVVQTIDRATVAHTESVQATEADYRGHSTSSNGVSVTSRDDVTSFSTDERFTVARFHETIRTVVFNTAAGAFSAAA